MPLFEYACEKCGHGFEELVSAGGTATQVRCPACQSPKVTKKFSTFSSAATARGGSASLPVGGCCPCGKAAGTCQMR